MAGHLGKPTNPDTQQGADFDDAQRHEDLFRAQHPWLWLATLAGPVVLTVALLGAG